jgi:enoyl-CoA hydratase
VTGTTELVLERRGPSLVARLNRPEARNALTPGLINGIGSAVAEAESDPAIRALILTGTGDRAFCACELGLVNAVVAADELLGAAVAVAERIAVNGPLAVAATKELVRTAAADATRGWERLSELQTVVFGSEDAKEGAKAFIEKRQPQWTGPVMRR